MTSFTRNLLIEKLREIKSMGFIKTHRAHDTGIGKTLEDLLGIQENNIRLPDFGDLELKAKRLESASMLTLATKSPLPRGVNKVLFEKYKYLDEEGRYNLHSTVCGSKLNPQGFKISIENEKMVLENREQVDVFWPMAVFNDVLKSKSNKVLLVLAQTTGERKSENEQFYFKEVYLLSNLSIDRFEKAIKEDWLKIDIRIGCYRSGPEQGKYHDHGTAFRINKVDYLHLYKEIEQIL